MKRSLLFAALLGLAMTLAVPALAEDYAFSVQTGLIERYEGAGGAITVPAQMDGAPMKALRTGVFNTQDTVTSITLPDTLEAIGANNFFYCTALEEVTVPGRVAYIGYGSFGMCERLRAVTFLGEVPVMGDSCFTDLPSDFICYVPEDQVEAYRAALPADIRVESTGVPAQKVDWTPAAAELTFDDETGTVTAYLGQAARVDVPAVIDGAAVLHIGDAAFAYNNFLYLVNLPEGVETIGKDAFLYANSLVSVSLPDSLRVIGEGAFNGGWHSAEEVVWPASLEEIGARAFRYTPIKGELHLEGRTLSIGENAFEYTAITSLYLDDSPVEIAPHAFEGSRLNYLCIDTEGLLPGISDTAFEGAALLEDLDLPWDSTRENQQAWRAFMAAQAPNCYVWINNPPDCGNPANADATYEYYPDGTYYLASYTGGLEALVNYHSMNGVNITGIGDGVFRGNQTLKKFRVTHSDLFTTIGAEAFADSAVEVVDLYYTTETIGAGAFRNCTGLTGLTIPASVKFIGEGAFDGCENLAHVELLCDADVLPVGAFAACAAMQGNPDAVTLAADATDAQVRRLSAELNCPWNQPLLRAGETRTAQALIEMPLAATAAENFTFDAETGTLTGYHGTDADVIVPREIDGVPVRAIGYNAFENCRDYTGTEVATNQKSWTPLRSVVLPETVTTIADSAFSYCQQLETVICYGAVESTGRGTFSWCRNLEQVIFVNGVGKIDNYAFEDTESLHMVYTPGSVNYLGENAFARSGIERLVVDAVQVANSAVRDCAYLREAHFTANVQQVNPAVIIGCPSLSLVCLENTDLSFVPSDGMIAGAVGTVLVRVPENTDAENQARAARVLMWGSDAQTTVEAAACDREAEALPDVAAMMQAYAETPMAPMDFPEAPAPIVAAPVGEAGTPYLGVWTLTSILFGDTEYAAADLNMAGMSLSLHEDGTCDYVSAEEGAMTTAWAVAEDGLARLDTMTLSIQEGRLIAEEDGVQMVFEAAGADGEEPAADEPFAESQTAPASDADRLEKKYVCVSFTTAGVTMDASLLQAEYAVTFHADQSLDFVMAGQEVPGLTWQADGDDLVVDYFGTNELRFKPDGEALVVDFFGGMDMRFEAA